jgi:hypothetical protein
MRTEFARFKQASSAMQGASTKLLTLRRIVILATSTLTEARESTSLNLIAALTRACRASTSDRCDLICHRVE